MGCGKSAVGRILARRLGRGFIDSDHEIERRAGKSVARLFSEKGEGVFRRFESQALLKISRRSGAVVALGGGALLNARNRKIISGARVVGLTCAEPELWKRLKPILKTRPLLAGGRPALKKLLRQRRPHYRAVAGLTISTSRRSPRQSAELIARRLQ